MAEGKSDGGSFVRRDKLISIEKDLQAKWDEEKAFELDAPEDSPLEIDSPLDEKFMATFPYPYMNGRLHLGHTFTVTKADFAIAYRRVQGKRCLFPFAFHCTGMPIKASADKIKREMEKFGCPPVFPDDGEAAQPEKKEEKEEKKGDPSKFHAKKSKVLAKTGKQVYQWNILKSIGVPEEEIPQFAEPKHWLKYFPPYGMSDLKLFGTQVDWRRTFITTDENPYYDSFVRWQFNWLKQLGKIQKGVRPSVYSPLDGQPCADHDRASGEGVKEQEYTLIKLELATPFPEKLAALEGKKVYFVAATLRPETMYGQTNCYILPDGDYGAFEMIDKEGVYVCSERSARNMSFQDLTPEFGKVNKLMDLKGTDILGVALKAPLAVHEVVYTLPMLTIKMNKGTGVVTSVPSDSPDDLAAYRDLQKKEKLREKYGITEEMVSKDLVPIIAIPGYGDMAAVSVLDKFKITSQNDPKLPDAKQEVYLKGFYEGVMLIGAYKGKKVEEAKNLVKDLMMKEGMAVRYYEPEKPVMSRSGDDCVVALTEQWYLDYGEDSWREKTEEALARLRLGCEEERNLFKYTLGWMRQWACSRAFGLGTRLPWDEKYLIESLSDSTIYNAYYTVVHLLQGGVMDGSVVGPAGIKAEQMTDDVWNYIFLRGGMPDTDISQDTLNKLRREFEYWYPTNLRVSGKDLIQNHLTMYLYNHTAIFPESKWPMGIATNGHVLLNNEKMSKSTGNFLTLEEAVHKYSADATKFALADAGDGLEDANFVHDTANMAILRLTTQLAWFEETLAGLDSMRTGEKLYADLIFENEINRAVIETEKNFENFVYRDALKTGFFELQGARDTYRTATSVKAMHRDLALRFIEVQTALLAPICPHFCDYVWRNLLKKEKSIFAGAWPAAEPIDYALLRAGRYMNDTVRTFRLSLQKQMHSKKKGKKGAQAEEEPPKVPDSLVVYIADKFPEWQEETLRLMSSVYDSEKGEFTSDLIQLVKGSASLKPMMKKVMPFLAFMKDEVKARGAEALELNMPFREKEILDQNVDYLSNSLSLMNIKVCEDASECPEMPEPTKGVAVPGKPAAFFFASA